MLTTNYILTLAGAFTVAQNVKTTTIELRNVNSQTVHFFDHYLVCVLLIGDVATARLLAQAQDSPVTWSFVTYRKFYKRNDHVIGKSCEHKLLSSL